MIYCHEARLSVPWPTLLCNRNPFFFVYGVTTSNSRNYSVLADHQHIRTSRIY